MGAVLASTCASSFSPGRPLVDAALNCRWRPRADIHERGHSQLDWALAGMMNTMRYAQFFAILACGILLSQDALAQSTLWQRTTVGMTVGEVQAVVPGTRPLKPDSSELRASSGSVRLLAIDKIEIANRPFAGYFYFRDGKLDEVAFHLLNAGVPTSDRSTYLQLVNSLRNQHGPESGMSSDRIRTPSRNSNAVWLSQDVAVFASMLHSERSAKAALKLTYSAIRERTPQPTIGTRDQKSLLP